jgi:hypothetical protein
LGGTSSFVVATTSDCSWTAVNTAWWISFTGASGGSGTRTVGFFVLPNIGAARSSTIVITGPGDGASFTVSQDGVVP